MSALSLGSLEVFVAKGGAKRRSERTGDFARSESNKLRTDGASAARVWAFETIEYDLSDANALLAQLDETTPFNASGDTIGGTVPVLADNVTVDYGDGFGDILISFDLLEADPA